MPASSGNQRVSGITPRMMMPQDWRFRELVLMAENGINTQQDIRILQAEFDVVLFYIESVISHTTYLGSNLFFNR